MFSVSKIHRIPTQGTVMKVMVHECNGALTGSLKFVSVMVSCLSADCFRSTVMLIFRGYAFCVGWIQRLTCSGLMEDVHWYSWMMGKEQAARESMFVV